MASSAKLATTATETVAEALKSLTSATVTEAAVPSATALQEEEDDVGCKDNDVLNSSLRSCSNDPNFAIICAFLEKFAKELGLELPNFKHLQEWLTNTDELHAQIRDLHIKLLRKTRKTVHEKSWESALSKFCFTYSAQDGWEVERFGYKQTSLKVKLRILRELLESQFERNTKFRNKILTMSADSLRSQPIGRDRLGHSYWLTQDNDCNLRIYQEHLDEEIWQVVATNRDELVNLITRLRGNEVVLPSAEIGVVDEDSSSNSCNALVEKPPPPVEQDDSQEEETKVPNLRIRIGNETTVGFGKGEEELALEENPKLEEAKKEGINRDGDEAIDEEGADFEEVEDEESGEEEEEEEEQTVNESDQNEGLEEEEESFQMCRAGSVSHPDGETEKKVKPLLISNVKIAPSLVALPTNNGNSNKRPIDELDKFSPRSEDDHAIKKFRPSLLDSKREKKPSRYEKTKSEDEDEDDEDEGDEDIDDEDDNDDDDEDAEELEGEEEEDLTKADDAEYEGEEEDIDSAAAEEGENEQKDIEDDDYDDEIDQSQDAGVSEAIEDPAVIVHGEGSGEACEGPPDRSNFPGFSTPYNSFSLFPDTNLHVIEVSEAIEEKCLYVSGDGYGSECLVGNKSNEDLSKSESSLSPTPTTTPTTTPKSTYSEPKPKFFFGEPGCLKLSPMKNTSTTKENDAEKKVEERVPEVATDSSNNEVEQSKEKPDDLTNSEDLKKCDNDGDHEESHDNGNGEQENIKSDFGNANYGEIITKKDDKDVEGSVEDIAQSTEKVEDQNVVEPTSDTLDDTSPQNNSNIQENNTLINSVELNGINVPADDLDNHEKEQVKEDKEKEEHEIEKEKEEHEIEKEKDEAEVEETETEEQVNETQEKEVCSEENIEEPNKDKNEMHLNENNENDAASVKETVPEPLDMENKSNEILIEQIIPSEEISSQEPEDNAKSICTEAPENETKTDCIEDLNNISEESSEDRKENSDDLNNTEMQITSSIIDETVVAEEPQKPLPINSTNDNLKEDPIEAKILPTVTSILPNRKRRLSDLPVTQKFNTCHYSTSESELDLNAENSDELPETDANILENEVDDNEVGGKRLKMRTKMTNIEMRKKVEAQKIAAAVEETTSSSCGEEDALRKRKMVSPKSMPEAKFIKTITAKEEAAMPKPSVVEEKRGRILPMKQKPTLDEIIEKKLKKSAESLVTSKEMVSTLIPSINASSTASSTSTASVTTCGISSTKKSPVTKPLKKNLLLTQHRHDESDEETIPRKRTVGANTCDKSVDEEEKLHPPSISTSSVDIGSEGKEEQKENQNATKRTSVTPDRQRKRRSSEDLKQPATPEIMDLQKKSSGSTSEGLSEKIKRSDESIDSLKCVENENNNVVVLPSLAEKIETKKEIEECPVQTDMREGSNCADHAKVDGITTTTTGTPTEIREDAIDVKSEKKEEKSPDIVVGRRSSRRGGTNVLYAELPQPKRTRGSTKPSITDKKIKQEEILEDKLDDKECKFESKRTTTNDLQSPTTSQSVEEIKIPLLAIEYKETNIKTETETNLETKALSPPADGKQSIEEVKENEPVGSKSAPKETTTTTATATSITTSTTIAVAATSEAAIATTTSPTVATTASETTLTTDTTTTAAVALTETPATTAEPTSNTTPAAKVGRGRGRRKREVDTTNIIETADSETPVRQSRRIAQQKIREEAERRKLEEIALRTMKNELKKKKKAQAKVDPTVLEPSEHSTSGDDSEVSAIEPEETKKSKKKSKKCPGKGGTWSSGSEEQEEPEEEEEPPHYETDPGSPLFKSDHEFSPESDLEDESQIVPMKRARTARKEDADVGDAEQFNQEEEACQKCGKSDHPEWILLCDNCDKGYHCSCLSPVLFYIPEGDWYCPPCQQEKLIAALETKLKEFDDLIEQKRLEEEEALAHLAEVERAEKERLEEESRKKKNKRRQKDDESDDYESNGNDVEAKHSEKESDADDEHVEGDAKKSVRKSKKGRRDQSIEDKKRREYSSGGNRRRRRRAAKRGARQRRRNEVNSNGSRSSDKSGDSGSQSGTDDGTSNRSSSSSSSETDSDDEPIYKLRKRRQINVSYRLNEYDDLINSALRKEMDAAAIAGNLGRGKDITTIIEAGKEEQSLQLLDNDGVEKLDKDTSKEGEETSSFPAERKIEEESKCAPDKVDSEDEPLKRKVKTRTLKRKPRKLTTLDISSEEDNASDEDFKGSSLDDEDEEDTSVSITTNSDSSLEFYKRRNKKGKKGRKTARHAARERRRVRQFVVEESDDDEEEEIRPKTKKKRKPDSDYSETEESGDEFSELSENMDSADLCDDSSSSEDTDGPWRPSKNKKQRKSNANIARKSPKLKKPQTKKPKRVEYSDDDVSEEEEEEDDYDDYDDFGTGGKGSGKQPRSVPLKICNAGKGKGKGKGGAGAGKSAKSSAAAKKKKKKFSDYDDDSFTDSDDSARRTRGRRYAYLEDFEDESSDGGIKPGVKRPDTPPEEREKFIKKQEEIKRMLAEKNAEGAKLAATPRLTPIKGGAVVASGSPAKTSDSLSTVPPSVIRQAKVLDIDYLQRKGESVSDVDNVDDVDSEFDDADLPDDFPEDMDEDAIARMVEEEESFSTSTSGTRELSVPDEVPKPIGVKTKPKDTEKPPILHLSTNPSLVALSQIPTSGVAGIPGTSASGLQEPMRKRLPMPTIHPPLLRHQFPGSAHHHHHHHGLPSHLLQRQSVPPTHLLQNALSAPLSQAVHRNFPQHPMGAIQRGGGESSGIPSRHGIPARTVPPPQQHLNPSQPLSVAPMSLQCESDSKPRGRRKKITPLRDPLQKQQAAAAVTAATVVQATTAASTIEKSEPNLTTAVATGVIKTAPSLTPSQSQLQRSQQQQQPQQHQQTQPSLLPHLYKVAIGSSTPGNQPSVITRMPHLPPHGASIPGRGMPLGSPGLFAGGDVTRFYGPPVPLQSSSPSSRRPSSMANAQRHRGVPHVSVMPPHHTLRPSYGPPPPLRGVAAPGNQPPPTSVSGTRPPYPQPHGDHRSSQAGGPYGPPPPARHAAPHLSPFRPSIFGNPNFVPRGASPGANMRSTGPTAQEYSPGPPRTYTPYGYYPPPPPLTAAHQPPPSAHSVASPTTHTVSITPVSTKHPSSSTLPTAVPSSVIVSAPPSTHSLAAVSLPPVLIAQKHTGSGPTLHLTKTTPPPPTTSERDKTTVVKAIASVSVATAPGASASASVVKARGISSSSPASSSASEPQTHTAAVVVEPRKKLITLETYATSKSPLAMGGESSGSRSSPNVQTDGADDSSSIPVATTSCGDGQGASEFSGLVSYFSSQHDDYNT